MSFLWAIYGIMMETGADYMPNIITHNLFAEEVYRKCRKKDIRDLLETHMQIYGIGANGPDFLFFYHMLPWEAYKEHSLNQIGSVLHKKHVNAFYESAVKTMRKEVDPQVKERELVYVMGHLCHWALDMTTHPYIFYRTGNCQKESAALHHRFESMLDAMMLQRMRNCDIKSYRCFENCEYDDEMLKAMARIYVNAIEDTMGQRIKVHALREALNDWYEIQKLLYDPSGKKQKLVQAVEKLIGRPWLVSGNIVPCKIDERVDVLNLQKNIWMHPCDDTLLSIASFPDLFDEAIALALQAIERLYGCVEYDADVANLCNILNDRAYDTGREGEVEMKYFDVIYDETV